MIALWIILALIALVIIYVISLYNRLVTMRNRVENAWAQIAVQLKRRFDLIPNLVNTVKGYAAHESQTLEAVIAARNAATVAPDQSVAEVAAHENALTGALSKLFALAESYPDLKANTNFMSLQEELATTEDKISYARQFYNDTVMNYNNAIEVFPANALAGMFGFSKKESFEVDAAQSEPVQVSF